MKDKKQYFKTVNGVNGINLKKFITFVFGIAPVNYEYSEEEVTYIFYVDEAAFKTQKRQKLKEAFENHFRVIIKPI